MADAATHRTLVSVRQPSQLDQVARTLQDEFQAEVRVVLTGANGTPRTEPYIPAGTLFLNPVNLETTAPFSARDMKPLETRFDVRVEELFTNSSGLTEAVSDYRRFYAGKTGSLEDHPRLAELLDLGYALKPWDILNPEERESFMELVNLYSEGDLFLSPELILPPGSPEETAQACASWLVPPDRNREPA